jgi:hypothetical protein
MTNRPVRKKPRAAKTSDATVCITPLTDEQADALQDFVQCLSIERARQAIESLAKVKRAGGVDNARLVAENVKKAA